MYDERDLAVEYLAQFSHSPKLHAILLFFPERQLPRKWVIFSAECVRLSGMDLVEMLCAKKVRRVTIPRKHCYRYLYEKNVRY